MFAENIGLKIMVSGAASILRTVTCRSAVAAAAMFIAAGSAFAQLHLPIMPPTATPVVSRSAVMVQQPGLSGQVGAEHSPNVRQLLKPEFKLEVERRHSQLVITGRNVRRLAVTDSGICNYVQYSPTELAVVGLELGATDLMIWFEGEVTPAIYEITVVHDENLENQRRSEFARLERRLAELFPNSNVYLVPIGDQVLLKGQAYDSEEADQIMQITRSEVARSLGRYTDDDQTNALNGGGGGGGGDQIQDQFQNGGINFSDVVVNMLEIPGDFNIKMRVIIAELSRDELRNMAIDIPNLDLDGGRHVLSSALGGATGTTLSGIFENGEISVLVRWLTTNGTATLLAEPTIVCMSGHSASLLAGGEFAVPTIIGLGGGQNTSFRGVGTSMVVTPTVIDRDLIRLQIVPEFSSINDDNAVNGIPGVTVKRVQTTVELREGQTLALGGLITRQAATSVSRIPLLGDIPYIGSRLFHSKTSQEAEAELLVLVTPEIVRPMEADEVPPLPNFYVTHPNDHDLYKYGRTEGNPDQNVYQVQPYGTGATHGVPSGYHMGSAQLLPQYTTPNMNGPLPSAAMPYGGAQPMNPQPEVTLPPPGTNNPQYQIQPQQFQQPQQILQPQQFQPAPSTQQFQPPLPDNAQGAFTRPAPAQSMSSRFSAFLKEPAFSARRPAVGNVPWQK
jgi:pilus assembly protein CpaC